MAKIQYIITEQEWKDFQKYRNDDLPNKIETLSAIIGRHRQTHIVNQEFIAELQETIDEQNLLIAGYKVQLKEFKNG